ncbi:MAG: beta-1,6-N-acetylglucosaminyltransferase [Lactobacillaceae bacterium]|jgi:hypothetical protein|nr:beta-1,6-N-acetylglucosaminyltransferase [Lactobacillaceae bacterium]
MKHAILILGAAHTGNLEHLVNLLDDPQIDIFLHWDKSSKVKLDEEMQQPYFKHINLVPRVNVSWGGSNTLDALTTMFKTATAHDEYDYLHLISDTDLPLMSKTYFLQFFANAKHRNFIGFANQGVASTEEVNRIKYYYPFMNLNMERLKKIKLAGLGKKIQMRLNVSRSKLSDFKIAKGALWGSFTGAFAAYVVSDEVQQIKQDLFSMSDRGDELFFQMLAINSDFESTIDVETDENKASARYIDWHRGTPFTFLDADLNEITNVYNTNYAFGRKFIDAAQIVNYLYEHK